MMKMKHFQHAKNRGFLSMNKRGITPLISTFILIAFAIGLGTMVMSWGNSERFKEASCESVEISVTSLNDNYKICSKEDMITATVENNGRTDIEMIRIVMLTGSGTFDQNLDTNIKVGEFGDITFPLQQNLLKLRLIPYLDEDQCIKKRFEIENIPECE